MDSNREKTKREQSCCTCPIYLLRTRLRDTPNSDQTEITRTIDNLFGITSHFQKKWSSQVDTNSETKTQHRDIVMVLYNSQSITQKPSNTSSKEKLVELSATP